MRSGLHILVFPEGTRSRDGRLATFKKGPFFLAQQTGAPIVPIALAGTQTMMRKGSVAITPGVARIELLPALPMLWQRGSIRGMRARGGVTVDIAWEGNRLSEAMLTADRDGVYPVRSGAREVTMKLTAGQPVRLNGALQPQ